MPVGAGGEELRRIEAALAEEDPAMAESFHRWGLPPEDHDDGDATIVGRRFGLALLSGLVAVAVGPTVVLLLLLGGLVFACLASDQWTKRGPASASAV